MNYQISNNGTNIRNLYTKQQWLLKELCTIKKIQSKIMNANTFDIKRDLFKKELLLYQKQNLNF